MVEDFESLSRLRQVRKESGGILNIHIFPKKKYVCQQITLRSYYDC